MWIILIIFVVVGLLALAHFTNKENQKTTLLGFETGSIGYTFDIVGEQSYQSNLKKIAGKKEAESKYVQVVANIISEPSNPYDKNAIKVEINGLIVGYINKNEAKTISGRKINKAIPAVINGGWKDDESEGSYGVKLAIRSINDLL